MHFAAALLSLLHADSGTASPSASSLALRLCAPAPRASHLTHPTRLDSLQARYSDLAHLDIDALETVQILLRAPAHACTRAHCACIAPFDATGTHLDIQTSARPPPPASLAPRLLPPSSFLAPSPRCALGEQQGCLGWTHYAARIACNGDSPAHLSRYPGPVRSLARFASLSALASQPSHRPYRSLSSSSRYNPIPPLPSARRCQSLGRRQTVRQSARAQRQGRHG